MLFSVIMKEQSRCVGKCFLKGCDNSSKIIYGVLKEKEIFGYIIWHHNAMDLPPLGKPNMTC